MNEINDRLPPLASRQNRSQKMAWWDILQLTLCVLVVILLIVFLTIALHESVLINEGLKTMSDVRVMIDQVEDLNLPETISKVDEMYSKFNVLYNLAQIFFGV